MKAHWRLCVSHRSEACSIVENGDSVTGFTF